MLAFYPTDAGAQGAVMELLGKMCPSREALEWLVDQTVNKVGAWKGPAELRGVLCWKFKPADGVEADSSVPGFTLADGMRISTERHEELHQVEAAPGSLKMLGQYLDVESFALKPKTDDAAAEVAR